MGKVDGKEEKRRTGKEMKVDDRGMMAGEMCKEENVIAEE